MTTATDKLKYVVITDEKLCGFGRLPSEAKLSTHRFRTKKEAEKFVRGAERWQASSKERGFPEYAVIWYGKRGMKK